MPKGATDASGGAGKTGGAAASDSNGVDVSKLDEDEVLAYIDGTLQLDLALLVN